MSELDPASELKLLSGALAAELERAGRRGRRRLAAPETEVPVKQVVVQPQPAPVREGSAERSRPAPEPDFAEPRPEPKRPAYAEELERRAGEVRASAAACAGLDELAQQVSACTQCRLARSRTQTVFADGGGEARVMFVGEAPGQHEDEQGVPFVGAAGQLLTAIIEKGMGLGRSEVYIANVLKCRPPENRDPTPQEKEICTGWLDRQIELVNPEVIIPLGKHAAQHILKSTATMGRMRGMVHQVGGRKVVPTYHPSYILHQGDERSPGFKKAKAAVWQDIQLAMRELGLERPRS